MLTTLPALCLLSLISLAYFLCEKNGVEQIVWPRPPRDDPVTLTRYLDFHCGGIIHVLIVLVLAVSLLKGGSLYGQASCPATLCVG